MQNLEESVKLENIQTQRRIGSFYGSDGPTIMILGGLHGNEPAGIIAFQRVLKVLETRNLQFKGQIHGFRGNLKAISNSERFLEEDMNRNWYRYMRRKASDSTIETAEDSERDALLNTILDTMHDASEPCIFFDLHSTSAPSLPFAAINDSIYNRSIVKGLPVPIILGLQEQIEGTLNGILNDMGLPAVLFEAGQHNEKETIDYHESFIWYMLYKLGCIQRNAVKSLQKHRDILKNASKGKEGFYEVTFRYPVEIGDQFEMYPGFQSFQPIENNQKIAKNNRGDIFAPHKDIMFMPLYQNKGQDGYFLIRKIKPIWMKISKWLRHRNIDNYIHYLPGVNEFDHEEQHFKVDKSIAFAFALQLFHLLGYRKERVIDDQLYVSRIKYDDNPPSKEEFFKNVESFRAGEH
ncbi:MAG: succinylglutamate desuccinylase/aspartoacylase family protein [Cytophagales bacterium]